MIYQDLFTNLTPGDVILTVNRRLATYLREQYAIYQQQLGHKAWHSPDILPLTAWLERCWLDSQARSAHTPLILLNPAQEQLLWEQTIADSLTGKNLLRITATAQQAGTAWQLTQQWCIDYHSPQFALTEDTHAWQSWAQAFAASCKKNHWLDSGCLPNHVINLIKQNHLTIPKKIFLVGFDELNPQYKNLLATLAEKNCRHQIISSNTINSNNKKLAFTDSQTEILSMARWCYQHWQENNQTLIACVIPNLSEIRAQVLEIFRDVFAPENKLPSHYNTAMPFNISGGQMLNDYALIYTALSLLGLSNEIALEDFSKLLRSPYLGDADQEVTARAQLDAWLRKQGEPTITLQQIITAAKKNNCNNLAQCLQAFIETNKNHKEYLAPSQWATLFSQQLAALAWPGARTLDSLEYQLREHWLKLLSEFASLDLTIKSCSITQALKHLHSLALTPFQTQSAQVPIQILGVLEAAGLNFEHLWIMGLHDNAWPPAANPNPFIPYALQRQLSLPHADSEREYQFAHTITTRLLESAPDVVLSYPLMEDDRHLRPSPLIHAIKSIELSELNLPITDSYNTTIFNSAQLDWFTDNIAPTITATEKISGGSAIFKHQAACPFRAFARYRLAADELTIIQTGLSAAERGSLLHRALEILWNKLNNQQTLIKTSTSELQIIITETVNTALLAFIKQRPLTFKKYFTEIEKQRLVKLLTNWLEKEKQRPDFTVLAIEQTENYTVANIPLKMRVDRIDQLADGSLILIDYKTGQTNINTWFGERLDEPQLPLYCIVNTSPIDGVVFAQIKSNAMEFKGVSADQIDIAGVYPISKIKTNIADSPTDWNNLLQQWRAELEKLGTAFYEGDAKTDPKHGTTTCRHCDMQMLCRVGDVAEK